MDKIRALIAKMQNNERNLMAARNAEWEASAHRTTLIVASGVVVAFAVLLFSILTLGSETSARILVEWALRQNEERIRLLVNSVRDYAIFNPRPPRQSLQVDFTQFRETVKQLGLYWLVVNQAPPPNAFAPK
jgi:hypothetical protein